MNISDRRDRNKTENVLLTYLASEKLWDDHWHIVLGTSLKGKRDKRKVFAGQNTFILFLSLCIMRRSPAYFDAQAQTAIRLSSQYNSSVL